MLVELLFYTSDGDICDYEITFVGHSSYIIDQNGYDSTFDPADFKFNLTERYRNSTTNGLNLKVIWRFESDIVTAPIFASPFLTIDIPRNAHMMVTRCYDNTRTPDFKISFDEDPSLSYSWMNIDQDGINGFRTTYFTIDGTSGGVFALTT